jgi:hypothetical protein
LGEFSDRWRFADFSPKAFINPALCINRSRVTDHFFTQGPQFRIQIQATNRRERAVSAVKAVQGFDNRITGLACFIRRKDDPSPRDSDLIGGIHNGGAVKLDFSCTVTHHEFPATFVGSQGMLAQWEKQDQRCQQTYAGIHGVLSPKRERFPIIFGSTALILR